MPCCTTNMPKLTKRVTIERLKDSAVVDGSGNVNEKLDSNWTPFASSLRVEIITKGSREFFRGQQVGEDITHQITMRYSPKTKQITTKMRVRFEGRKLAISQPPVNIDEDKRGFIRMACKEVPVL